MTALSVCHRSNATGWEQEEQEEEVVRFALIRLGAPTGSGDQYPAGRSCKNGGG